MYEAFSPENLPAWTKSVLDKLLGRGFKSQLSPIAFIHLDGSKV